MGHHACSFGGLDLEYGSMPRDVLTNSELKKTCRRQGGSSSAGPPPCISWCTLCQRPSLSSTFDSSDEEASFCPKPLPNKKQQIHQPASLTNPPPSPTFALSPKKRSASQSPSQKHAFPTRDALCHLAGCSANSLLLCRFIHAPSNHGLRNVGSVPPYLLNHQTTEGHCRRGQTNKKSSQGKSRQVKARQATSGLGPRPLNSVPTRCRLPTRICMRSSRDRPIAFAELLTGSNVRYRMYRAHSVPRKQVYLLH